MQNPSISAHQITSVRLRISETSVIIMLFQCIATRVVVSCDSLLHNCSSAWEKKEKQGKVSAY